MICSRRSSRSRNFNTEPLEEKVLLSAGSVPWGINVDGNVDWSSLGAWVDATNTFRRWGDAERPWEEGAFPNGFTDQGIPLDDSGTLTYLNGYTAGTYRLSFEGTGEVSVRGLGKIVDGSTVVEGGITSMDVTLNEPDGSSLLHLMLTDVDPINPVRNLKFLAPGYDDRPEQVFRDEFADRLQPFEAIRFMDWADTNNSKAIEWDERRETTDSIQTVAYTENTNGGIAWENMIALANQTGKDAWINVPHLANEDYIRNLANLWRDNLNADQRLIVEYSNETWNVIFDQAQSDRWNYYDSVGPRVLEVSQIFREAFHDQPDRLEIVLAGQSVNAYHVTEAIRYFQDQGFQARDVVDVIAIAPYIDADRNKEYVDLDTLFADIDQQVTGMARHQAIAEFHGLKMYAYEAGQHLVPGATDIELVRAAQNDPRMAAAYHEFASAWSNFGGDLVMAFSLARPGSNSGFWGLLDDIRDPGSRKWDAVMSEILAPGDASLDGTVDFEDFSLLQDNFGLADRWWEQGDFNADNKVDESDFLLMVENLDFASFEEAEVQHLYDFAERKQLTIPNQTAPVVSIGVSSSQLLESSGRQSPVYLELTGADSEVTVKYLMAYQIDGQDYDRFVGTAQLGNGISKVEIPIAVDDDRIEQGDQNVRFELLPSDQYFRGTTTASVVIVDDDKSPVLYDDFDGVSGPLDGQETGAGFNEESNDGDVGWYVQNHDKNEGGYRIDADNTLSYPGLQTSGGLLIGGQRYLAAGRKVGDLEEFKEYGAQTIGRDDTTLWMSVLVERREAVTRNSSSTRVSLNTSRTAWYDNDRVVSVGYFGRPSFSEGQGFWSLEVDGVIQQTDVPIVQGEAALLVVKIDFADGENQVSLFVNPVVGTTPTTANAKLNTSQLRFRNVSYYGGNGQNASAIDELRFGADFATVAPDVTATGSSGDEPNSDEGDNDPFNSVLTYEYVATPVPSNFPDARRRIVLFDEVGRLIDRDRIEEMAHPLAVLLLAESNS